METATAAVPQSPSLLDLPDKALLTVLCCLAADARSLFSAARAHSTLHQLIAAAVHSLNQAATPQQVASLQLYLARHGQHLISLQLRRCFRDDESIQSRSVYPVLDELPGLKLQVLVLRDLRLQLLPGNGRAGVLQPGAPIKYLEISNCPLRDPEPAAAFARALSQLPQLEHIKCANWGRTMRSPLAFEVAPFPGHILSDLQRLTSLDLLDSVATRDVLDFVHLAPGLRNLKASYTSDRITGSKLSALQQLTSLQLRGSHGFRELHFDPAGLANKGQLRRLQMDCCDLAGENAGVAALLSQLQQMKQLTHLALRKCWLLWRHPNSPPAAAYAALTASSALQHLDVSDNTMPQGVWQHVLPAGRQLPQLRVLHASHESCGTLGWWTHADTARLASCCPNLQAFKMHTPHPLAADVLPPLHSLQQLTALETGRLDDAGYRGAAVLTQLSKLDVWVDDLYGRLLPLTRLQRLTHLYITGPSGGLSFLPEATRGRPNPPVWQQVLEHCKIRGVVETEEEAAAGLEPSGP